MSTSSAFLRIQQCLTNKRLNKCIYTCISVPYLLGLACVYISLTQMYVSNTYITRQCQVTSVEVRKWKTHFQPYWTVSMVHENQTKVLSIKSAGVKDKSLAWTIVEQHMVVLDL